MNARTPPARGAAGQLEPLRPLRDLASLRGDVSVHARGEPTHRYAIRRRPIVHLSNLGIADLDERREGRNLTWQDRKAHVDRARVAPVVGGHCGFGVAGKFVATAAAISRNCRRVAGRSWSMSTTPAAAMCRS